MINARKEPCEHGPNEQRGLKTLNVIEMTLSPKLFGVVNSVSEY